MHHNPTPASTLDALAGDVPARRRRRPWRAAATAALTVGLALATASTAAAVEPTPVPEPPDPTPAICVQLTTASSFTTRGGPFASGTELRWTVSKACPEVVLRLAGQTVSATGSVTKDPLVTTEYRLVASMGTATKTLGSQIALGGDVVGYAVGRAGPVPFVNPTGADAVEARRVTSAVTGALSAAAERELLGTTLEVHIIPWHVSLTSLPPWRHLAGKETCDGKEECVGSRPWSEVRGVGGTLIPGTARIALAVGQEELTTVPSRPRAYGPGFALSHELGHTVLDIAVPAEHAVVDTILDGNPDDHEYAGRDDRTSQNADEYFATSTSALFEFPYGSGYADEFRREWLAEHDPAMLAVLDRVYPGAP